MTGANALISGAAMAARELRRYSADVAMESRDDANSFHAALP